MVNINSEIEWNNFITSISPNDSANRYSGNINITSNFLFTSAPQPIYLENCIVDGQCHVITLQDNTSSGLFVMSNSSGINTVIKNLTIDGIGIGNIFSITTSSLLLFYSPYQRGYIINVHIRNGGLNGCSGLLPFEFGDNTNVDKSIVTKCSVSLSLNAGSNGYGSTVYYTDIKHSFFKGSFFGTNDNGFIDSAYNCTIDTCYSNILNSIENTCSGFINQVYSNLFISKSYVVGNLTGNIRCAGFILQALNQSDINIQNCYHIGNVDFLVSDYAGCFIGEVSNSLGDPINITFGNCYSSNNTNNGGSLIGKLDYNTIPINIFDCHIINSTLFVKDIISGSLNSFGSLDDLAFNVNYSNWDTFWDINASDYPTLKIFKNLTLWDNTYTLSSSVPNFTSCILSCNCNLPINISSQAVWIDYLENLLYPNNFINPFTSNINITSDFTVNLVLQVRTFISNDSIVDGLCHTLILNDNRIGLFIMPTTGNSTCEIKNLTIDCNDNNFNDDPDASILLFNEDELYNYQRGKITNVHIKNGTIQEGCAGLLCNKFGDAFNFIINSSEILVCSVKLNLDETAGFCKEMYNSRIQYSFFNGTMSDDGFSYGFIKNCYNCDIVFCYSKTNIPDNSAGFIKDIFNSCKIDNCYVVGNVNPTINGIGAGFILTCRNNCSLIFEDCYFRGDIIAGETGESGGFIGSIGSTNTIDITFDNCYSTNSNNLYGSFIGIQKNPSSSVDFNYCHIKSGTSFIYFQTLGIVSYNNSFDDLMFNTLYTNFSSWTINFNDFPTLNSYYFTVVWDGTYKKSRDTPDFACFCNCPIVPCFAENTPINTLNGIKFIQNLIKGDIVDGYEIETILKSPSKQIMIKIEKNALGNNLPTNDTFVTKQHLFEINNKHITAGDMIKLNPSKIYKVNPISEHVYHIVLKNRQYAFITVNGLKAETLGLKFKNIANINIINNLAIKI